MYFRKLSSLIFIFLVTSSSIGGSTESVHAVKSKKELLAEQVESERQLRIQLMTTLDADLKARALDRKSASDQSPLKAASDAAPLGSMQYNGLQGDYYGGVFGTFVAALTLLIVIWSAWSTRKSDAKSKTYQIFTEMLRTHEEIVNSMTLGDVKGREAISLILREFSFIYKTTLNHVPSYETWDMNQRLDISFTFAYYGPQLQTIRILERYDAVAIKAVGDAISAKMHRNASTKDGRHRPRLFRGHQNRLSHYFRNLFGAYKFIEESKDLSKKEKQHLGKVLRTKLSNYEQALLCLNIQSHLGREWTDAGILNGHQPIKNIPKHFFSFDETRFSLKGQFPNVTFEWEGG
jgi:hypothetical protein